MSRPIPFKKAEQSPPSDDHTIELLWKVFEKLAPEQQSAFARQIAEKTNIETQRGSEVLKAIVKVLPFLPKEKEWTVSDLKERVEEVGVMAAPKEFYNAVGYLKRKGDVTRVGYGRYMIGGALLTTTEDFGGETTRHEDEYKGPRE